MTIWMTTFSILKRFRIIRHESCSAGSGTGGRGTTMRVVLDHSSQGAYGVKVNGPLFLVHMLLVNSVFGACQQRRMSWTAGCTFLLQPSGHHHLRKAGVGKKVEV